MPDLTNNLHASSMHNHKKTPLVALTQGVTQTTIQQPGFANNHTATRLSSPQRHLPHGFTSPFFGDFAPSLDVSSQILTIFGSAHFVKG